MKKALYPSIVVLPDTDNPPPTILDFLEIRFPSISRHTWQRRMEQGKVHDEKDRLIGPDSAYLAGKRVFYYREVAREPKVPFNETIVFANDHLMVACKPHFLPVIPAGSYVNECLLNRLRSSTGNPKLTPVNRIDRETAGLVVFSVRKDTRALYHELFQGASVKKTYEAICTCNHKPLRSEWIVENRIVKGSPFFRMKVEPGIPNARTHVYLEKSIKDKAFFTLKPVTGKKHQIRIHMSELGYGILNDRYYPVLQPETKHDFNAPLQLLARKLEFRDPVSGHIMEFVSKRTLSEDW